MIYQPAEDTYLIARTLARFVRGRSVLDIGAGSGFLTEAALNAGASSVIATDINPEVIEILRLKRLSAVQSDLFENISGCFDVIVCNPPYLPDDTRENPESKVALAGGKHGDEVTLRFLKQAPQHLTEEGILLILLSSLTPKSRIILLLKRQRLQHEVIATQKLFMERLEVWKIMRDGLTRDR